MYFFFLLSLFGFLTIPAFGGHVVFLLGGLVGALTGFFIARAGRWSLALAALPVFGLLFGLTYTIGLIALVAAVVSAVAHRRKGTVASLYRAALAGVPFTMLATWQVAFRKSRPMATLGGDFTWYEGFQYKAWSDRQALWSRAASQMREHLPLIAPGGRPIVLFGFPNGNLVGPQEWSNGLHNIYLESFFQMGWLGGIALSTVIAFSVLSTFSILAQAVLSGQTLGGNALVPIIASACLAIFVVGGTTGQFLIETIIGTWFWLGLGIVVSYCVSGQKLDFASPPN